MKHSYNKLGDTCALCGRAEYDHSDSAQCEACPATGPCEVIGTMLLCALCQEKELRVAIPEVINEISPREARITELTNLLGKEIPVDSRAYFVSEVTAITDIEKQVSDLENPQYALAELVEKRLFEFRKRLFQLKNEAIELKIDIDSDQRYLNIIVPKLREEEREKFKNYDITYKPSAVASAAKPSAPRMSANEKAYASMAAMLGISVEAYKRSLETAMKNATGAVCTCQQTPGLCKVHPKG